MYYAKILFLHPLILDPPGCFQHQRAQVQIVSSDTIIEQSFSVNSF